MAQRLIDADHLLHEIAELQKSPWYNTGKEIDPNFPHMHIGYLERKEAVEIVRDLCIKQEPTVDAEPVRHGRWTYLNCFEKGRYQCNECGHFVDAGADKNYCPNCGAKMEGDENAVN